MNLTFTLLTDNYPGETTWSITDGGGSVILGEPLHGQIGNHPHRFGSVHGRMLHTTVNDSYGDGLQYAGVLGNYTLVDGDGQVLTQMIASGSLGSQAVDDFRVEATGSDIPGCTDSTACNYVSDATTDDGSRTYGLGVLPRQRQRRRRRS